MSGTSSFDHALPGVFNRGYLRERLPEEAARARRGGHSLSVVRANLDHFKKINDSQGDFAGGAVLHHAAGLVRSALRQSDWMAHDGGDGFVIVLIETHLQGAYAVAERLRRLCAENPVTLPTGPLTVTASFGVSSMDNLPASRSDADADVMLKEADAALHESERAGHNRVTCAPIVAQPPQS